MMKVRTIRAFVTTVCALALVGLATACSGTAAGSKPPASSIDTVASQGSSGTQAAQSLLATASSNPSSILITEPLTRSPGPQTIVNLIPPGIPAALVYAAGVKDAATTMGWTYKSVAIDSTPSGVQNAFQAALEMQPKPAAITTLGYSVNAFRPQLAQAKSMGIAVILTADTDVPGTPGTDGLTARVEGGPTEADWGQTLAAFITADSKGTGQVALFSIPSFPILSAFDSGLESGLKQFCPGCRITEVDQQPTDVGTKTPQSVVNTLSRNPGIKYTVFAFGDLTLGVHAAFATAGISGVKILGAAPTASNLAALRNQTESGWVGAPEAYLGWRAVDAAARALTGQSETQEDTQPNPSQLLTPSNVDHAVFDSTGNYIAMADYRQQFMQLWKVGH
jgi:ribose transport system substrate-binding protein